MIEIIKEEFYQSLIYDDRYLFILEGVISTLVMAVFAIIIGFIIGLLLAFIITYNEYNKKLNLLTFFSKTYVTVIRGTPVLLQLMIIYYIMFASININVLIVGIIAFGINSAAYVCEIIRSGINSVDYGQMEAARALGLTFNEAMRHIILPQAFKNVTPALGNEFVTLVKETSVAGYIGIMELTKAGDIIASRTYNYFFPLIISAIIYLCITLGISKLLDIYNKRGVKC